MKITDQARRTLLPAECLRRAALPQDGVHNGPAFHFLGADRRGLRRYHFCNRHDRQTHLASIRFGHLTTKQPTAIPRAGAALFRLDGTVGTSKQDDWEFAGADDAKLRTVHVPADRRQRGARPRCLPGSTLPPQAGFRYLGFHGSSGRCVRSGFTVRRLTIARGDQFFLKLQPFVGYHNGLFALRRQLSYQGINGCFRRRRRRLRPRVHQ
jgi:hypothetical protein